MNHDERDDAIDRVAAKLVSVAPDPSMLDRLAAQLPAHSRRRLKPSPSKWRWLAPQVAAAIGVAVFAFFLFSNRPTGVDEPTTFVPAPAPPTANPAPAVTAAPAARAIVVAKNVPVPATMEMDHSFDRDFGLRPMARPGEIILDAIAAVPEIAVPATDVAPITLTDLPLANDSPTPR